MDYGVGTKALFNSLSAGLVKVVVIAIAKRDLGGLELRLRVTGRKQRYFHCGYTFEVPDVWVIPRAVFHKSRKGPFRFWTEPYAWKEE
jgi:hypothetical protein